MTAVMGVEQREVLAGPVPGASIAAMEGCGLVMCVEQPAEFNRRALRFPAAHPEGARRAVHYRNPDKIASAPGVENSGAKLPLRGRLICKTIPRSVNETLSDGLSARQPSNPEAKP